MKNRLMGALAGAVVTAIALGGPAAADSCGFTSAPAPARPSAVHIGEFMHGPIDVDPPQKLVLHYASYRTREHVQYDCDHRGGTVVAETFAGYAEVACWGIDY